MSAKRKLYLNKPQRIAYLINGHEHYHVWGRGTGKTEGPIALRSINAANKMPRGATGMVAATYIQILTRTLPPLEKAWQRYGYMPGIHYWVGEYPPKHLKIPRAIYHPRSPQHCIFWWNGHVRHFMSLDRPGLSNGKTVDALDGDEVRFMNFQRYLDDIAPTNRGNREIFGHLPEHHQITFCTDMPHDQSGKWILEKEKEMNRDQIAQILNVQLAYNDLKLEYEHPRTSGPRRVYLARKLRDYQLVLDELRKNSVFYSEATSLDNIEILGEDQFHQWKREMKPAVYDRAILNKRILQIEGGFYNMLNLDKHTYDAFNYSFIDELWERTKLVDASGKAFKPDCRSDGDINKQKPLDVAFDANGYFSCAVVGQQHAKEYRMLKSFHEQHEEGLEGVCKNIVDYYHCHPTKEINFYYDHTFLGTDAIRKFSYAEFIAKQFRDAKWKVNMIYIGQQPLHKTRYEMWSAVFKEADTRIVPVRLNKTNCDQLLICLQRAGTRQGSKGVEKDKRPEGRKETYPPEEATHLTDAFDTIYIGKFKRIIGKRRSSTSIMIT
jgi:hypothetical protein